MKLILLVASALLAVVNAGAQYVWHNLPNAPHSHRHDDMYFLNPQKGWVINPYYSYLTPHQYGQVWTTNDGGATWTKIFDSSVTFIRCVGFADSLHGWFGNLAETGITPDTNALYQTADGGHTWSPVTNISGTLPKGICGISVVSDSVVYAYGRVDRPARLMKTTDQGYSWTSADMSAYADFLIDGWFFNKDTGFIVGAIEHPSKATILSTFDGGVSWQQRYVGSTPFETCWKLSFPTRNIGYASIESAVDGYPYPSQPLPDSMHVLKTTDGGLSWTKVLVTPGYYDLQGIGFLNDSVGWVGGDALDSATYITTDGGINWKKDSTFGVQAPPYNSIDHGYVINRFRRFGDTLLYACGNTVYKLDVPNKTAIKNVSLIQEDVAIYPNPATKGKLIFIAPKKVHGKLTVEIMDIAGKLIDKQVLDGHRNIYQMNAAYPKGTYLVIINFSNGARAVRELEID